MINTPFIELAYSFNYDNPFPNDNNKEKLNTLKKMIKSNLSINFNDIDTDIKFYDLNENITEIYMDNTKCKKINELFMIDDIRSVISSIPRLVYFNNWINKFSIIEENNEVANIENNEDDNDDNNEEEMKNENKDDILINDNDMNTWDSVIPISPSKFDYSKTNGLTNYDIASEKPLSYEEIRKLTVNIARSKLKIEIEKSEQVIQLEKEKRKELMNNIQKYRNISAIGVLTEDNICEMNLDQLEHTLQHCEKLFQMQKLKEVIKRGTNFASLISSTVFPNGIKIGNKRIRAKGTGKIIIENIFDTQSTVGVAFQNIINKHHWNITDEAVLMLSIGEMFINSIKVENEEKKEENPKTDENKAENKIDNNDNDENETETSYYEEEEDEEDDDN